MAINGQRVRAHYDRVSKWYSLLCGEHIHQGYWEGVGSIKDAQEQLVARLAGIAQIPRGAAVLDVGCGLGGSAFWLAECCGCSVLGITNSRKQAALAWKSCRSRGLEHRVRFAVLDANILNLASGSFDIVWTIECAEHLADRERLIQNCLRVVKPDGRFALGGWAIPEVDLRPSQQELVDQLCSAMLCHRPARLSEYLVWLKSSKLTDIVVQDWTENVRQTAAAWMRTLENHLVRLSLRFSDPQTKRFVEGCRTLEQAYRASALRYVALAGTKQ